MSDISMTDFEKLDDSFSTIREEIKELKDSTNRVVAVQEMNEPPIKKTHRASTFIPVNPDDIGNIELLQWRKCHRHNQHSCFTGSTRREGPQVIYIYFLTMFLYYNYLKWPTVWCTQSSNLKKVYFCQSTWPKQYSQEIHT